MTPKKKSGPTFSFQTIIRLILFSLVVYFSLTYLSQNNSKKIPSTDPTVLGVEDSQGYQIRKYLNKIGQDTYQNLPPRSRELIENLPKSPAIIQAETKLNELGGVSTELPQKIITETKKMIIKTIYENIMKELETQK